MIATVPPLPPVSSVPSYRGPMPIEHVPMISLTSSRPAIVDVPATDDYPEVGHHECQQCGERVQPRQKADDCRQYIAGLREYLINGQSVSPEEFERRWRQRSVTARRAAPSDTASAT